MAASKIMLIRHAEKPSDDGSIVGVSQNGSTDPEELIVRGWQRSAALVRFFKPIAGPFSNAALATPDVIFASAVAKHSNSLRPQHTVLALAEFLGQQIDLSHTKGEEIALVADAMARSGNVLVAWEHEVIPAIAGQIAGTSMMYPQQWPGERFDLVWVFDRTPGAQNWTFTQVPQMLLSGDVSDLIPIPLTMRS
ncbi:MAG: hypothetical protein ABSE93_18945 [Terriglobia bacterium]|jgi:hypothetical protein